MSSTICRNPQNIGKTRCQDLENVRICLYIPTKLQSIKTLKMGTVGVSKTLVKRRRVPSVPRRQTGWLEVQLHSFRTLATQRDEWLILCSCCFTHRVKNTQYPLKIGLAGPKRWSGRFGTQENVLSLPEFNPRSSRPQPSHYTDWATLAPLKCWYVLWTCYVSIELWPVNEEVCRKF